MHKQRSFMRQQRSSADEKLIQFQGTKSYLRSILKEKDRFNILCENPPPCADSHYVTDLARPASTLKLLPHFTWSTPFTKQHGPFSQQ